MVNNKKALSTVVTTLIIILLVLVAIGIIWAVISNVVTQGAGNIDYSVKCLQVDVKVTAANCTNYGTTGCTLTLSRSNGGDEIAGVKILFSNDASVSSVIDDPNPIQPLQTVTRTIDTSGEGFTQTPTKVEVTPYLKDDQGEERLCSTSSFSF